MTEHIFQDIVNAQDLTIGYRKKKGYITIAEHLNIHIYKGEMVCLLGPNGCGKSTLIRTLAGMQQPLQGYVFIEGGD
ncbi:MAG TPA: ABC transporter ATP-binding protein, partial [Bacteroidales bacterium]|nr:ABC transporter ATP-binding protein [Bacteroidales bacterium]